MNKKALLLAPCVLFGLTIIASYFSTRRNIQFIPAQYTGSGVSLEEIMDKLNDIERKITNHQSYVDYKAYREKLNSLLPKIVKGDASKLNSHMLLDFIEKTGEQYRALILVSSNAPHDWRRDAIRSKWGNASMWATTKKWRVIFVTGGTEDKKIAEKLHHEAMIYKDLIMEDVVESFYKLSMKVMIGLQWAHTNFNYDFILKCDDDIFIQIDRLMVSLDRNNEKGYFGQVMGKQPVMRKGRYGLTAEEHVNDYFDPYCSGGAFLISYGTVNKIIPYFDWERPLKIDDAYIGHLVHKVGVPADREKGFHMWNRWCEYTDDLIISHPVKKQDCMQFLVNRAMIDNNKLKNETLRTQRYAYTEEERKHL